MVYNPDQERVNRLINRLNNPRSEAADLPQGQQREGPNDRREEWNSDQPKETRASQILDALTGHTLGERTREEAPGRSPSGRTSNDWSRKQAP